MSTADNPVPDIEDLEDEADQAIRAGRAPRWQVEEDRNSMRSTLRVGEVTFDLSWQQGQAPLRYHRQSR